MWFALKFTSGSESISNAYTRLESYHEHGIAQSVCAKLCGVCVNASSTKALGFHRERPHSFPPIILRCGWKFKLVVGKVKGRYQWLSVTLVPLYLWRWPCYTCQGPPDKAMGAALCTWERERGRPWVCRRARCNAPIIYPSACTWSMTMHKTLFPTRRRESERIDARIKIFNLLLFGSVMGRAVFVLLHDATLLSVCDWILGGGGVGVLFITTRDAGNSIWINLGWLGAGITFQLMPRALRGAKRKKKAIVRGATWQLENCSCVRAPRSPPAEFWCRLHQTEMLIAKPVFALGSHRQNHQRGREHLICGSRFMWVFLFHHLWGNSVNSNRFNPTFFKLF